jgi:hypothetical protein
VDIDTGWISIKSAFEVGMGCWEPHVLKKPMKSTTFTSSRLRRVFLEGFSAMDIAEPLVSFDYEADSARVREFMVAHDFDLVGVRCDGTVAGYVRRTDLESGSCGDFLQPFVPGDDLVSGAASLLEVVKSLAINSQCFVTILDHVGGIVTLSDLEKPPMRMFLFGIITLGEMLMTDLIRHRYPDDSWRSLISPQRYARALELQKERRRRGQNAELLDCLQYGDKGWILSRDNEVREALGQNSRREARLALKELETLRNNLAHTQEIIPTGWRRIIIACSRFEQNLELLAQSRNLMVSQSETSAGVVDADRK